MVFACVSVGGRAEGVCCRVIQRFSQCRGRSSGAWLAHSVTSNARHLQSGTGRAANTAVQYTRLLQSCPPPHHLWNMPRSPPQNHDGHAVLTCNSNAVVLHNVKLPYHSVSKTSLFKTELVANLMSGRQNMSTGTVGLLFLEQLYSSTRRMSCSKRRDTCTGTVRQKVRRRIHLYQPTPAQTHPLCYIMLSYVMLCVTMCKRHV